MWGGKGNCQCHLIKGAMDIVPRALGDGGDWSGEQKWSAGMGWSGQRQQTAGLPPDAAIQFEVGQNRGYRIGWGLKVADQLILGQR